MSDVSTTAKFLLTALAVASILEAKTILHCEGFTDQLPKSHIIDKLQSPAIVEEHCGPQNEYNTAFVSKTESDFIRITVCLTVLFGVASCLRWQANYSHSQDESEANSQGGEEVARNPKTEDRDGENDDDADSGKGSGDDENSGDESGDNENDDGSDNSQEIGDDDENDGGSDNVGENGDGEWGVCVCVCVCVWEEAGPLSADNGPLAARRGACNKEQAFQTAEPRHIYADHFRADRECRVYTVGT
jgi:hypothetical protein